MIWLNKIETILSIITSTFAGTIIWTGDTNINIKVDSDIQKRYTELFNNFTLVRHIQLPTKKVTKIKDHIIPNILNEVIYSNVLPYPSTSDHDVPYIIVKSLRWYTGHHDHLLIAYQRLKTKLDTNLLEIMKEFEIGKFKDFRMIPLSSVYCSDDPEDQSDILNKIILLCIEEHTTFKRVTFTRPPAPWMKNLDIVALLREWDQLIYEAHLYKTDETWNTHRKTRNKTKRKMN